MIAAARIAIGIALLTKAFTTSLTAQEDMLPALAFQTPAEAKAFASRLALLQPLVQITNALQAGTLEYRIRAKGAEGTMIDSLTLTNLYGRQILRATRTLNIAGKHQVETSDLEPGSLLPIRHTRHINEPDDTIREDIALWDHAGLRFFCEGNRIRNGKVLRQLYRREWRLGKDLPANIVDGLTAFVQFRGHVLAGLADMRMPVIAGGGERFDCMFSRVVDTNKPWQTAIEQDSGMVFMQRMIPESKGPTTAVRIDMSPSNAIPQRFEGVFFGMNATLDLVSGREVD